MVQTMKLNRKQLNCNLLKIMLLTTISAMAISSVAVNVRADVPQVIQIENISQDSTGMIRLTIAHINPTGSHYVDTVEVDLNGQVTTRQLQPQSNNPFTIDIEAGQLQQQPNVRVRAHCNLHGWGAWSNTIQVPEFTEIGVAIFVALAASLLIIRRTRKVPHV